MPIGVIIHPDIHCQGFGGWIFFIIIDGYHHPHFNSLEPSLSLILMLIAL